jgi:hypothetical protein
MRLPLHTSLTLALLAAATSAQATISLCAESFDHPTATSLHGTTGGSGWANAWWATSSTGASTSEAIIPGLDAQGGAAHTLVDDAGSYRKPDSTGFEHLQSANGNFGADNQTLWISFRAQRSPGSDDQFGGVSLYEQFVSEHLFLGCPNTLAMWGIHDDPGNNPTPEWISGTSVDTAAQLVYRIDFLPGDERLRMWLDPVSTHPTTPADIDTTIHDFTFNELGFKAGNSLTQHGYLFDDLRIDTPEGGLGTPYCLGDGTLTACPCGNNSTAGGCQNGTGSGATLRAVGAPLASADTLTLSADGLIPSQPGLYFQGNNAINSGAGNPFGDGLRCAGGGVQRLEVLFADPTGASATTTTISSAGSVSPGDLKRYQLWYRDPLTSPCGAGFNLSNGLEIPWGA